MVVATTAKPMRSTVAMAMPSHSARSRCLGGRPGEAMPMTRALSADSTTLTKMTCNSALSAAGSNRSDIMEDYCDFSGGMMTGCSYVSSDGAWSSILTLLVSTLEGLSNNPVTMTGNATTSATMISCRPTQGSAPQ